MSKVENPFLKSNPYAGYLVQPFKHPAAYPRPPSQYSRVLNVPKTDHHTSRALENNWVFNENNLTKRTDFSRKYEKSDSKPTSFETQIKMAKVTAFRNEAPKRHATYDGPIENPFFRKNLLVDQEEVKKQVELDVSSYRPKAKTAYEPAPAYHPPSNYVSTGDQSPIYAMNRPSISRSDRDKQPTPPPLKFVYFQNVEDTGSNTLRYSQTQRSSAEKKVTPPVSVREDPEQLPPATLQFNGKKFYLRSLE